MTLIYAATALSMALICRATLAAHQLLGIRAENCSVIQSDIQQVILL
jgi:hypothetical protein